MSITYTILDYEQTHLVSSPQNSYIAFATQSDWQKACDINMSCLVTLLSSRLVWKHSIIIKNSKYQVGYRLKEGNKLCNFSINSNCHQLCPVRYNCSPKTINVQSTLSRTEPYSTLTYSQV